MSVRRLAPLLRRPGRVAAAIAAALALTLPSAPAAANGRLPQAGLVALDPTNPARVVVRSTFGLLVSNDGGRTFAYVCEAALGANDGEDPMVLFTGDGALHAGTFAGLRTSYDGACSFATQPSPGEVFVLDLATRAPLGRELLVQTTKYLGSDAGDRFDNRLYKSNDFGRTVWPLGTLPDDLNPTTVDLTESDPDRVYATGTRADGTRYRGVLLVSRDGGRTFVERPVPLDGTEIAPYVAAVDPDDADRVWIRTYESSSKPSRLLLTEDAGATFREIFRATSALEGFALANRGRRVYFGGPLDRLWVIEPLGTAPRKVADVVVNGLTARQTSQGEELWAASNEASGFAVGLSRDGGRTFETRLRLPDTQGVLACPSTTPTATVCPAEWDARVAYDLGAKEPPIPVLPPPTRRPDAGATDPGASDTTRFEGGACSSTGGGAGSVAVGAVVAVVLGLARRRRATR